MSNTGESRDKSSCKVYGLLIYMVISLERVLEYAVVLCELNVPYKI